MRELLKDVTRTALWRYEAHWIGGFLMLYGSLTRSGTAMK